MKKLETILVCTAMGLLPACSTTDKNGGPLDIIENIQDGVLYPGGQTAVKEETSKSENDAYNQTGIVENVSQFYTANLTYKPLAEALIKSGFSSAIYDLEARKLSTKALKQSRLPQARPEATIDQDGQAVGRLLFEQLLIGSGRLRAEKSILTAQESGALAEYRIEANDDIAKGITAYLNMCRFKKLSEEAVNVVALYESFLEKAEARVRGGAANRNEARLFELKTAQAQAQKSEFEAEYQRYKAQLSALTGTFIPTENAATFQFDDIAPPPHDTVPDRVKHAPVYQLQLAMLDQSVGEAFREKAARRPELSLSGSAGRGSRLGLGSDNNLNSVRLGLSVTQPIVWGKDYNKRAFDMSVEAAKAGTQRQLQSIAIELQVLDELIKSYHAQLIAKKSVADLAEQRALSFEKDFKAGAVSIVEVVSILETVKTVKLDYIDMEFLTYEAELLKAQTLGVLGPLPVAPTKE